MKTVKIFFLIGLVLSAAGCLKDKPNVDLTNIQPIAEISSSSINPTHNAPSSGLDYFNQATLPYIGADTVFDVTFDVNIASEYPPTKDITVTLAVDDAKRVAYNTKLTPANQFLAQPDSTYNFPVKTAVIKAGSRLATFTVTYYPQKLDPVKSYMLPITLTDASGLTISGNLSTIYLHIIGNPLAGSYLWDWSRWNAQDSTSTPSAGSFVAETATFVPVSATSFHVKTGYYLQPNYLVSFTNTNGVLSDFKVVIDPTDLAAIFTANGISLVDGPNIFYANPTSKVFEFQYTVFNGSAYRYIKDKFYK